MSLNNIYQSFCSRASHATWNFGNTDIQERLPSKNVEKGITVDKFLG
jgi:hypothetical protein